MKGSAPLVEAPMPAAEVAARAMARVWGHRNFNYIGNGHQIKQALFREAGEAVVAALREAGYEIRGRG